MASQVHPMFFINIMRSSNQLVSSRHVIGVLCGASTRLLNDCSINHTIGYPNRQNRIRHKTDRNSSKHSHEITAVRTKENFRNMEGEEDGLLGEMDYTLNNFKKKVRYFPNSNSKKVGLQTSGHKTGDSISRKNEDYFKNAWLQSNNESTTGLTTDARARSRQISSSITQKEDDLDSFGSLSMDINSFDLGKKPNTLDALDPNDRLDELLPDDGDLPRDRRLNIPLTRYGRKGKTAFYYTRKMSILGREGKVKEAIEIFEHWMMLRDRVMPNKRTFVTLIGILGRVGYTRKAFQLFRQMKHLGLDAEEHVYTSLFNACANSPSRADGLRRAENLLNYFKENDILPNLFTVKACVKALAVCGDFPRAFTVMDEAANRLSLDTQCLNALLIACAADKQSGFRRAIQVWQKMAEFKIRPETNSFNLFIRCIRDCHVGNPSELIAVLCHESSQNPVLDKEFLVNKLWSLGVLSQPRLAMDKSTKAIKHTLNKGVKHRGDAVLRLEVSDSQRIKLDDKNMGSRSPVMSSLDSQSEYNSCHLNYNECIDFDDEERDHTQDKNSWTVSSKHHDVVDLENFCGTNGERSYEWWEEQPKGLDSSCENESRSRVSSKEVFVGKTQFEDQEQISSAGEISLKDLKHPEFRLALIGGASRLLTHMNEVDASPDIRTFTQILSCLPNNEESELSLLMTMEELGMSPDVDFLNDIMMRRNRRHESHTVKELLRIIAKFRLCPNMRTYAALALACHREEEANQLISDIEEANLEPSVEVMGHFLYISRQRYGYKLRMLRKMEAMGHKPNKEIIAILEKSIVHTKRNIVQAEKGKHMESFYLTDQFRIPFRNFLNFYRSWLLRTPLDSSEHPWIHYETEKDVERRNRKSQ